MAQFKNNFVQDLTQKCPVRTDCGLVVFNADDLSNVITVELLENGEPATVSGTVVGSCICPDGATVPITNGSIGGENNNKVSITLTGDCFALPGQIGVGIQLVTGAVKTTVLKAVYNVEQFDTETVVDPGSRITADVSALVTAIETARASIPADYTDLMAAVAPTFSTSATYAAGQYVWYNGKLYRFSAAHTGAWNASHAALADIGTGLYNLIKADADGLTIRL